MASKPFITRMVSRGAAFGLQTGILIWIIMLLQQSVAARGDAAGTVHHVTFGPLLLMSLGKQKVDDSFVASFSFEGGLLPYVAVWLVAGIIAAFVVRWLLTLGIRDATD